MESTLPQDNARAREASDWLVKLHNDDLSSEQISDWLEWSQRDPANLQTFEQMKVLMRDIRSLDADRKAEALRCLLSEKPLSEKLLPEQPRAFIPVRRYALAASILIAVCAGGYWLHQQMQPRTFAQKYVTAKSEARDITLPDGTEVWLGADSYLTVNYTDAERKLDLVEGEAFFTPEEESARSFHVRAGQWRLIDIGTAFNVRKTRDQVVVTVAEGIVDVTPLTARHGDPGRPPLRLVAGEQAVIARSLPTAAVSKVDVAAASSWQNGQLRFSDEPLSVVVANLNRYSDRQILLDPRVERLRFSGTVLTGNVEGWIDAACRVFNLVREPVDGHILLLPYRAKPVLPAEPDVGAPSGTQLPVTSADFARGAEPPAAPLQD